MGVTTREPMAGPSRRPSRGVEAPSGASSPVPSVFVLHRHPFPTAALPLSRGLVGLQLVQGLGVNMPFFVLPLLLSLCLPYLGSEEPGTLGAAVHQRHGKAVPSHR